MKKLLFIILILISIQTFAQQNELWQHLSDLLEMPQRSLIIRLPEGTCIGSSMGFTTYISSEGTKVTIDYDRESIPTTLEIIGFQRFEELKPLIMENNVFIPIKGYRTYYIYYSETDKIVTLIRR